MIVAQRIGTIRHADKIIVLDDGKMAGIGTHEELMKNCEVFMQWYGEEILSFQKRNLRKGDAESCIKKDKNQRI